MKVGNVEMRSSKARCVDFSIVEKYKEITMDEKKKFIWFVLMLTVMIVIFIFSNQNGETSHAVSNAVAEIKLS